MTQVLYPRLPGHGWSTVTLMARMLARLLDADLVEIPLTKPYSKARLALGRLPRRRNSGHCIVIASNPGCLAEILSLNNLKNGFEHVSGWVIDSFWTEQIPDVAKHRGHFDQLFITDGELVDDWSRTTGTPTTWLPFGADVLSLSPVVGDRPIDLLRVGRQPDAWEDDRETAAAAAKRSIRFAGRAPSHSDPVLNQHSLLAAMSASKYTLSFSNVVSPAPYTHSTREYLTGRWMDALACGATVAGIAPKCMAASELLWPESLLELGGVNRDDGLQLIADAKDDWKPADAKLNHLRALERLDWRWRFKELVAVVGLNAPTLNEELGVLCQTIQDRREA